jgi:hypothetical protein
MKKWILFLNALSFFSLAQSQPESPWLISGNNSTIPGIHFLGTIDNKPLQFRVSNVQAGLIDSIKSKTFLGFGAGKAVTSGYDNTAVGFKSLYSTTIGYENVAIGAWALSASTNGAFNSAVGNNALRYNTNGSYNVALGRNALMVNTTGYDNTAVGTGAMSSNTTGNYNTANGINAMLLNTSGIFNTATGESVLYLNNTGSYNTANGSHTLTANTGSYYNTAVGDHAGSYYNMGWNNTLLGAYCDVNAAGLYNCLAVGEAVTCTASSQARIGNSSTVSIGGYVGWTNISDGRYKKDIREEVKGLDFIMKLHPVTYHLDVRSLSKKLNEGRGKEKDEFTQKAIEEKEKIIYSGFIAQDVEKAAIEVGYDFSGVDKPKNENDLYGLRYAEFVVPLVKSVQELSAQNTALKNELEEIKKNSADQKKLNEDLLERLKRLESSFVTKNNK